MGRGIVAAFVAMFALLGTPAAAASSNFEQQVLSALNAARATPAGFAADLRRYRALFHGNVVALPGSRTLRMTREGTAPVDEAIAFLDKRAALPQLTSSVALAGSAAFHVADQGARGLIGHSGSDGSSPIGRIEQHGGSGKVAEVIQYGADDPWEVVRNLIVDDGVAGRGHRRILFDPALHVAGIACGRHRDFGTMCVIDFAAAATATSSVAFASAEAYPPARMTFQADR